MSKRKALGSGLEALLSAKSVGEKQIDSNDILEQSSAKIRSIPLHEISRNKDQPRQVFLMNL